MASKPVFTILCAFEMVFGFLTVIFGMIDRIGIQMQISFLMLPIWNGMLFGLSGFAGLIIGRQNQREGYISSGRTSGLKAINLLCFGLSLLTFYMYGSVVMYSGFRIEFNSEDFFYPTQATIIPKQLSTLDGTPDDDTRQGIFAMIIIFSLVEMFMGAWIVMLEKGTMILGSSTSSDQVPLITSDANQYIQPTQYAQPSAGMIVAPPQVQQQQQPVYMVAPGGNAPLPARAVVPVYMVAPGGNAPLPARAVVAPISQQQMQQQPSYVVLQPSAGMATNQPQAFQQPQPRYVVMQNQVPNAPPAQHVTEGDPTNVQTQPIPQQDPSDVRTDSPAPQTGDVHSPDGIQQQWSGLKE